MSTDTGWRALPPWARWVGGIIAGVILLNVAMTLLADAYGGPEGRPSSSYATAPEGTAAFAELLARRGHPVVPLRGALTDESLPEDGVLVVLDPENITGDEVSELTEWTAAGGDLVIGGRPQLWARGLLPESEPEWSAAGIVDAQPLADVSEMKGVARVGGEGFGSWEDTAAALPVAGLQTGTRTLVAVARIGSGRAVLLADPSLLHNRHLARHDNAVFAVNLGGPPGTPVYFAEGVHGYGNETGLMAIPFRWKLFLIGLALASIVWMVAAGRRLGPPEPEARELPPPRRAYVEALATTLARTKRADEVVAPVRAAVRSRIAQRAGLDSDPDAAALEGAGRALGLTEQEIAAISGRTSDPIATGRALAKLGGSPW